MIRGFVIHSYRMLSTYQSAPVSSKASGVPAGEENVGRRDQQSRTARCGAKDSNLPTDTQTAFLACICRCRPATDSHTPASSAEHSQSFEE